MVCARFLNVRQMARNNRSACVRMVELVNETLQAVHSAMEAFAGLPGEICASVERLDMCVEFIRWRHH